MAGEKYADLAVASLLSYVESNLQTYLTAVETAQSLDTGAMTAPDDYVGAWLPKDAVGVVVQVFCQNGDSIDPQNDLYVYDCTVALLFQSDAGVEAGQLKARRYLTALVDTIKSGRTLGGTVVQAIETDQSLFFDKPGNAETMHVVALGVDVTVYEG